MLYNIYYCRLTIVHTYIQTFQLFNLFTSSPLQYNKIIATIFTFQNLRKTIEIPILRTSSSNYSVSKNIKAEIFKTTVYSGTY